jgi:uroporphyrinogen III methyltransferase/synthase
MTKRSSPGTVYLVGAGPGDPGLITLRGVECLQKADVVLYDYLVNAAVVRHAPNSAELVLLKRDGPGPSFTPDSITTRMLEEANKGRTVVRLKGGDPSVFGRGFEETIALRQAGIPYEVIPGITTGLAVAAYSEIPVTHHDDASAVALIAGRERDEKADPTLDLASLARFPGTLVFYMGVGNVAEWSQSLIGHGKPPDTPVAIVRWCSRPDQETHRCTLATAASVVSEKGIRPPSVFVVGRVVDHAPPPGTSWFAARPLFGRCMLLPGSPSTSSKLNRRLAELGAEVITAPAIRVVDPPDWGPVDAALDRIDEYDWLVFSSGNGVDYLLRRLNERGEDVRRLAHPRIAAMGSGTADRLSEYGIRADLMPDQFVAESLAQALISKSEGGRFLLARASRGRQMMAQRLEAAGARVDQVVVYGNADVEEPDPKVAGRLDAGGIDWVAVTSSATARSLDRLYGKGLRSAQLVSMGPITSDTLQELGLEVAVEASPQTSDGLVDAVLSLARQSKA